MSCSKFGFTAQSLPVLVHGVQSMQELRPIKEFRTLIANEESLDALLEIRGTSGGLSARKRSAGVSLAGYPLGHLGLGLRERR